MDLHAEAERLRLDVLAVRMSAALAAAGVPHALLKGPSTANWLYDPPRRYRDVDLLVPLSRLTDAVAALAGLAAPGAGRPGEEAEHSLLLLTADGFELDLHFSLPTLPADGDRVWDVLGARVETLALDVGELPALDEAGRCLVLALHALGNAAHPGQAEQDLRRARRTAAAPSWTAAAVLARRVGGGGQFQAGLGLVEPGHAPGTTRARLYAGAAPPAAFGLLRLSELPRRELPRALARELLPSRGFMARADPAARSARRLALARAHLRRWQRLARRLPGAVRAWRRARR